MTDGTDYYVNYPVEICGLSISFTRYNKSNVFDVETGVSTQSIFGDLISLGVDMNTIQVFPRIIDGRNGATGSASVTRLNSDVYDASYIISPRSILPHYVWGRIIIRKWCPSWTLSIQRKPLEDQSSGPFFLSTLCRSSQCRFIKDAFLCIDLPSAICALQNIVFCVRAFPAPPYVSVPGTNWLHKSSQQGKAI